MNDAMMRNDSRSAKRDPREVESEQERSGSFGAIYDRYAASIFRYLISRTGNVEEAKDLTSQTFLTAMEAFSRYRDQGYASAWLFSIARSKYIDHLRKTARQRRMEQLRNFDLEPDVLNQVVATERIVALRKRLRALPNVLRARLISLDQDAMGDNGRTIGQPMVGLVLDIKSMDPDAAALDQIWLYVPGSHVVLNKATNTWAPAWPPDKLPDDRIDIHLTMIQGMLHGDWQIDWEHQKP
ncbi:MAG: sigma-70 family RNA polymerase sigma factor [Chloroflexi bacterium]|nr:sigma-70 family RNA polymerase sigma factor [Chloroflexota bacterium]